MNEDWIEHRRADGERIGWIRMVGEHFIAVDVLGREITGEVDWLHAEESLDERGLAFLAERWLFDSPARGTVYVRIVEVSRRGIRVREDDFGAAADAGADVQEHDLPFPAPATLRPVAP